LKFQLVNLFADQSELRMPSRLEGKSTYVAGLHYILYTVVFKLYILFAIWRFELAALSSQENRITTIGQWIVKCCSVRNIAFLVTNRHVLFGKY